MGLGDVFKQAAVTAGNIFGDVFSDVRYEQLTSAVYDASAGTATPTSDSVTQKVLFSTFNVMDIPGSHIQPGDARALIVQEGFSLVPSVHDRVHRVEHGVSTMYEVTDVSQDPAAAVWDLVLRKP